MDPRPPLGSDATPGGQGSRPAGSVQPARSAYLRPARDSEAAPDGWVAHAAGMAGQRPVEVVFQEGRHDILVAAGAGLTEAVAEGIAEEGWEPLTTTDTAQVWVRDRAENARRALDRCAPVASIEQGLER